MTLPLKMNIKDLSDLPRLLPPGCTQFAAYYDHEIGLWRVSYIVPDRISSAI